MKHNGTWKLGLCLLSVLLLALFTGAALAENAVTLTVDATDLNVDLYGDPLHFTATAPGADHIALWSDQDILRGHQGNGDSETWEWNLFEPGEYTIFAVATYPDGTSALSNTLEVNVNAQGYLTRPEHIDIPAVIGPDDDLIVAYDALPDEVEGISYWLCWNEPDGELHYLNHDDTTPFTVAASNFEAGHIYEIEWGGNAPGYRDVHMHGTLYVGSADATGNVTMTLNGDTVPVYTPDNFDVRIELPEGVTAARFIEGGSVRDDLVYWGEWEDWLEEGAIEFNTHWGNDIAPYWAEVTFDQNIDFEQENWQDGVDWVRSNIVTVINTQGWNGRLDKPEFTVNFDDSVARGDMIEVTLGAIDSRAQDASIDIYDGDQKVNDRLFHYPHNALDRGDQTICLPTSELEAGKLYRLEVGVYGFGCGENYAQKFFTVTEPASDDAVITFAPDALQVFERGMYSAMVPGADTIRVFVDGNMEVEADGDQWFDDGLWYEHVGERTFRVVGEADGEIIGEVEATLNVTAWAQMPIPVVSGPAVVNAGDDVSISWFVPDVDYEYDQNWSVWVDKMYESEEEREEALVWCNWEDEELQRVTDLTIPGDCLEANRAYFLNVEYTGENTGIERPYRKGILQFVVLPDGEADNSIFFDVNGAHYDEENDVLQPEVWTSANAPDNYYYVAAPDCATAIRVFDGQGNWWYNQPFRYDENGAAVVQERFFMPDFEGEIVMFAEYTTDEVHEDMSEEDWMALAWSAPSRSVRIHVASESRRIDPPVFYIDGVEDGIVERGQVITVQLQDWEPIDGLFYWTDICHYDEESGDYDWWDRADDWNGMGQIYIPTNCYMPGNYRLVVKNQANGLFSNEATYDLTVVDPQEITFDVQTRTPLVREEYRISAFAPGAIGMRLFENGEEFSFMEGDNICEYVRKDDAGDYTYSLVVFYETENEEDSGAVDGGSITVTVEAPGGKLGYPVIYGEDIIYEGENYYFDFDRTGAEYEFWLTDENDEYVYGIGEQLPDSLVKLIPHQYLSAGHTYRLYVEARAGGSESSQYRKEFLVLPEGGDNSGNPDIYFTVYGSKEPQEFQINEDFLMWMNAPNATAFELHVLSDPSYHPVLDAYMAYAGDTTQKVWEGVWNFDDPGTYGVFVRYTTDPSVKETDWGEIDWDSLEWSEPSNVIFITVNGKGPFPVPEFEVPSETVKSGEILTVNVNLNMPDDEELSEEDVYILSRLFNDDYYRESWWNPSTHSISIATAGMAPGAYTLEIWTEALGYQHAPRNEFFEIFIEENDEAVTLDIQPSTIYTGEEATFSISAPGASRIYLKHANGDDWDEWEADFVEWQERWEETQDFTLYVVAVYPNGTIKTSPQKTLNVISRGQLPYTEIGGVPELFNMNDGNLDFGITEVEGAYEYEMWVDDLTDDCLVWYQGRKIGGPWSVICSVPNSVMQPGHVYQIAVGVSAPGYERSIACARFVAIAGEPVAFTLPAGIRKIDDEAFTGIPANYIVVPDGVEEIGANAFANCPNLQVIEFHGDLYSVFGGALDDKPIAWLTGSDIEPIR